MKHLTLLIFSLLLLLTTASFGAEVRPPAGFFEEGTETRLSPNQVQEILPWAKNSQIVLKDLLDTTRSSSALDAKAMLTRGIEEAVLASAPKQTEILMRYILNRALKVNEEIAKEADLSQPGVLDQQVRVLRLSIALALDYYSSDVEFLNGRALPKETVVNPPFADFGVRYVQFLMSVDQSLLSATAQYNVAVIALGLFQWDLYRDKNHLAFSPILSRIQATLSSLPERLSHLDSGASLVAVKNLRILKTTYHRALTLTLEALPRTQSSSPLTSEQFETDRKIEAELETARFVCRNKGSNSYGQTECYKKEVFPLSTEHSSKLFISVIQYACNKMDSWDDNVECYDVGLSYFLARKPRAEIVEHMCKSKKAFNSNYCFRFYFQSEVAPPHSAVALEACGDLAERDAARGAKCFSQVLKSSAAQALYFDMAPDVCVNSVIPESWQTNCLRSFAKHSSDFNLRTDVQTCQNATCFTNAFTRAATLHRTRGNP